MQNVNLYVPELRPKKEWLTAETLVAITVCFFLLLALSVIFNYHQLHEFEKQVVALENQRVITEKRLDEIKSRSPRDVAGTLDSEIASLRNRIHQRVQISELIGSQNLGHKLGYSARLTALAEAVPSDVSLTRFKFFNGATHVSLQGYTRESASVAEMIAQINDKKSFEAATFGKFTLIDTSPNFYSSDNTFHFSFGFTPLFDPEDVHLGASR